MFPFGFNIACAVCVGMAMGDNNPALAVKYSKMISMYAFIMDLGLGAFIVNFKREIAQLFTDQMEIVDLIEGSLVYVALSVILIGIGLV
jgi:Na+-driven multidrug efflux pump